MKYYLGQCEYKWTHKDLRMEQIWIQRELGDELYKTVESNNWNGNYNIVTVKPCQMIYIAVVISM